MKCFARAAAYAKAFLPLAVVAACMTLGADLASAQITDASTADEIVTQFYGELKPNEFVTALASKVFIILRLFAGLAITVMLGVMLWRWGRKST
ncbi:MAG: hypothetical protein AAF532_09650 [Planctomycetota bacterium]